MVLKIDSFSFAAVVEDFKPEPDKYYIVHDLQFNRDFVNKVKVLEKPSAGENPERKSYF